MNTGSYENIDDMEKLSSSHGTSEKCIPRILCDVKAPAEKAACTITAFVIPNRSRILLADSVRRTLADPCSLFYFVAEFKDCFRAR